MARTSTPVFYMLEKISLKPKQTTRVTYADPGVLDGLVGSDPFGRVNR